MKWNILGATLALTIIGITAVASFSAEPSDQKPEPAGAATTVCNDKSGFPC